MSSEYEQNLRLCQEEGNHGVQYLQTEMGALQHLNKFQSEEQSPQRGMLNGLTSHMDQHVGSL
eukprot:2840201-Prorocentrum_lima.AAC.1